MKATKSFIGLTLVVLSLALLAFPILSGNRGANLVILVAITLILYIIAAYHFKFWRMVVK